MRYKSNILNDTTWKLKISECSSVITFKNLSRIAILCGFQNIGSFSIFVTMSIHSWLLFILIACWLAISEETTLKSSISFSWIKFLQYPLSQFKSSKLVQRCVNWKDVVISNIPFLRWYDPMWINSTFFLILSVPQVFPKSLPNSLSCQNRVSSFGHRICSAPSPDSINFSPDSKKPHRTYSVVAPDLSGLRPDSRDSNRAPEAFTGLIRYIFKNLNLDQNLHFSFVSSISLNLRDHVNISWCINKEWIVDKEICQRISLYVILSKVIVNY
jgi:hypothetical protein